MVKQDEIPRIEKPGTNSGYYLFMEDDSGCMIEQQDKEGNIQLIKDTDKDQILPTDQITETEAEMYQIPEKDDQPWKMMQKQSAPPAQWIMTWKR